jgi:cytochrome c oxidase accessory protein FixG
MDFRKFRLLLSKWGAYFLVSSIFAHSFIAYFAGSDNLIGMLQRPPGENWTYFLVVSFVTGLLMFDFGWFREQFCIIMCPYGRFQSVLMDARSLVISYDAKRGEPRKNPGTPKESWGDCVSCNRCVQVCPTGIDIRNGLQMECVACTACIDACDEIMTKVKKPTGLISYQGSKSLKQSLGRPRILLYISIMVLLAAVFIYDLATRAPYQITILRAKDTPYQVLPEDKILNHFKAHLRNQSHKPEQFTIDLPESLQAKDFKITQAQSAHHVLSGETKEVHFFLTVPKVAMGVRGEARLQVRVVEGTSGRVELMDVVAVGPAGPGSANSGSSDTKPYSRSFR